MKKNKIIIFSILAGIMLILISLFVSKNDGQKSSTDPLVMPVKESLFKMQEEKNFKQLSSEQKIQKTIAIIEDLPPEYKTQKHRYQVAMSPLPDISFYGRVIDQDGQPVRKARVRYSGTSTYLSAGSGRGLVKTDEEGYFEIDTVGAKLVIGAVSHPGHVFAHQPDSGYGPKVNREVLKSSKIFLSGKDNRGVYSDWHNHSTKETAYIIKAWRLGEYAGAVGGNITSGFDSKGSIFALKLTGNHRTDKGVIGGENAHLLVSCKRKPMSSTSDYGDWSATITPINGGIQQTQDQFMMQAPESGYQSSIEINMNYESQDYESELTNQRYYFKSNNGKEYGNLLVHFRPHAKYNDNACVINITYTINPTGSRSLEKRPDYIRPRSSTYQSLASSR